MVIKKVMLKSQNQFWMMMIFLIMIMSRAGSISRSPSLPRNPSPLPRASPSSSPPRKVRRLSDIYERCQNRAHEEDPIGETINFALLAKADFEPSCFEDRCANEVWMQAMNEKMHSIHRNET